MRIYSTKNKTDLKSMKMKEFQLYADTEAEFHEIRTSDQMKSKVSTSIYKEAKDGKFDCIIVGSVDGVIPREPECDTHGISGCMGCKFTHAKFMVIGHLEVRYAFVHYKDLTPNILEQLTEDTALFMTYVKL